VKLPERVAILLVSLALAIGLIAVLSGYFAGQDPASVSTSHRAPLRAP
jgi:ABC-type transporter Mla maintaining outer membrane lipid asymmetry permease subunit MlaE